MKGKLLPARDPDWYFVAPGHAPIAVVHTTELEFFEEPPECILPEGTYDDNCIDRILRGSPGVITVLETVDRGEVSAPA